MINSQSDFKYFFLMFHSLNQQQNTQFYEIRKLWNVRLNSINTLNWWGNVSVTTSDCDNFEKTLHCLKLSPLLNQITFRIDSSGANVINIEDIEFYQAENVLYTFSDICLIS